MNFLIVLKKQLVIMKERSLNSALVTSLKEWFTNLTSVVIGNNSHLVLRCKYCAPLCDKTSCSISKMRFVYGFATEEAFKSRRSTFSEHLKSSTHGSQLNKFRIKVALAQGAPLPKQSGQIIGYLTPIDPYTEAVLKRRIRTAHKVGKKNPWPTN